MKVTTVGIITSSILVISGLSFVAYYDYKRRNDPQYRKQKKKERKREVQKVAKGQQQQTHLLIQKILDQVAKDSFPTVTEEKEAYFMNQVSQGESLVGKGEAYYDDSVLPFYRALKVYPKPLDLVMMYQRTIPDAVFQIIISVMSLEQKNIQNGFYHQFPPKDSHVLLKELSSTDDDGSNRPTRRALVADKTFKAGDTIYSETPLTSALHPSLEGSYCNLCLKRLLHKGIECSNCKAVVYCSMDCERQGLKMYHQFLCTNDKFNPGRKETTFDDYCRTNNLKYPHMIARFLAGMVAEEMDHKKADHEQQQRQQQHYTSWDHVERMRYLETVSTQYTTQEINIIKDVLINKVPGVDQFLTDDIYLILKGKMSYNAYPIPDLSYEVDSDDNGTSAIEEQYRSLPSLGNNKKIIGAALYKISTYLGQSMDNPNVEIVFDENSNKLSVVALQHIDKDQELKAHYVLPS